MRRVRGQLPGASRGTSGVVVGGAALGTIKSTASDLVSSVGSADGDTISVARSLSAESVKAMISKPLKYPINLDFTSAQFDLIDADFLADFPDVLKDVDLSKNSLLSFPQHKLSQLKRLILNDNKLECIRLPQHHSGSLVQLSLSNNLIHTVNGLMFCKRLMALYLDGNRIGSGFSELRCLPCLQLLDLSDNGLCLSLQQLYRHVIVNLQPLQRLRYVAFAGNPMTSRIENFKYFIISELPQVKFIDYEAVTAADVKKAKQLVALGVFSAKTEIAKPLEDPLKARAKKPSGSNSAANLSTASLTQPLSGMDIVTAASPSPMTREHSLKRAATVRAPLREAISVATVSPASPHASMAQLQQMLSTENVSGFARARSLRYVERNAKASTNADRSSTFVEKLMVPGHDLSASASSLAPVSSGLGVPNEPRRSSQTPSEKERVSPQTSPQIRRRFEGSSFRFRSLRKSMRSPKKSEAVEHTEADVAIPEPGAPLGIGLEIPYQDLRFSGDVAGFGRFGYVQLATLGDDTVCVKSVPIVGMTQEECMRVISKELQMLRLMSHANLVAFIGTALHNSELVIVNEYLAGGSLFELVHSDLEVAPADLVKIALDVSEGLLYLHSLTPSVAHGSISTMSILLDSTDAGMMCAKISDVRVGKIWDLVCKAEASEKNVTSCNWSAPEVLSGEPPTTMSDIYSIGVVLWEMFSRRLPYDDMRPSEIAEAVCKNNQRPEIPDKFPNYLRRLINICWNVKASMRPNIQQAQFVLRHPLDLLLEGIDKVFSQHKPLVRLPTAGEKRAQWLSAKHLVPESTGSTPAPKRDQRMERKRLKLLKATAEFGSSVDSSEVSVPSDCEDSAPSTPTFTVTTDMVPDVSVVPPSPTVDKRQDEQLDRNLSRSQKFRRSIAGSIRRQFTLNGLHDRSQVPLNRLKKSESNPNLMPLLTSSEFTLSLVEKTLESVLGQLESHAPEDRLRASRQLKELVVDESDEQTLIQILGPASLVRALARPDNSENFPLLSNCLSLVSRLVRNSSDSEPTAVAQQFIEAGIFEALSAITAVQDDACTSAAFNAATALIQNYPAVAAPQATEHGLVSQAAQCLAEPIEGIDSHSRADSVRASAAVFVSAVCTSENPALTAALSTLVSMQTMKSLISMVDKIVDGPYRARAAEALAFLLETGSSLVHNAFLEADGFDPLVDVLHSSLSSLRKSGLLAVLSLLSGSRMFHDALVFAGVIPPVLLIMDSGERVLRRIAAAVVAKLCESSSTCHTMYALNAVPILLSCIQEGLLSDGATTLLTAVDSNSQTESRSYGLSALDSLDSLVYQLSDHADAILAQAGPKVCALLEELREAPRDGVELSVPTRNRIPSRSELQLKMSMLMLDEPDVTIRKPIEPPSPREAQPDVPTRSIALTIGSVSEEDLTDSYV